MKTDMCLYINCLSGDDPEIFEKLITTKFHKFRHFYRLLEGISDTIERLYYNFSSDNTLEVMLSLTDPDAKKETVKFLKEKAGSDDNYDCNITTKKENINVVITLEE